MRRQGPNALPHFTMTHYTELLDSKGLVLVRGDVIHPQLVSRFEASACGLTPECSACKSVQPAGVFRAWECSACGSVQRC